MMQEPWRMAVGALLLINIGLVFWLTIVSIAGAFAVQDLRNEIEAVRAIAVEQPE